VSQHRVVVVGAGLGGSLVASLLHDAGYAVTICERRPDPRKQLLGRARSINLALSERGLLALERAGLRERVLSMSVAMPGRMIHDREGQTLFQPYGASAEQAIFSISRGGLNQTLVEAAEARGVEVLFDRRCEFVDLDSQRVRIVPADQSAAVELPFDLIVGADGAPSAVRDALARRGRFDFQQAYLPHGYKELTIPPRPDGGFRIEPHALHIWPRGGFMVIALPNADGSFTVTCFWPHHGANSFSQLTSPAEVTEFFSREFPDLLPLMPDLATEFFENPTSDLATIRCWPWVVSDRLVLIGDAAHAIVPFYGEGANAAFEDGVLLVEALRAGADQRAAALQSFQRARKPDAEALADLALANFVEMRDKTGSRWFLWGKLVERWLGKLLPFWFKPLYSMVRFWNWPYAAAIARAEYQWRVVRWSSAGLVLLIVLAVLFWAGTR
jgi:kynurenine 3-monooxygenase